MDKLWAPWRMQFIRNNKSGRCIFCNAKKLKGKDYVVLKTKYSIVMLNIYPYNNGHLMVSPLRHIRDTGQLSDLEMVDLFKTINYAKNLLDKILRPAGYNIGINMSKIAGAGIAGHLHIHIVPRWRGDNNFMPVIYNTKIISQSLDELFKQLKNAQSKTDNTI